MSSVARIFAALQRLSPSFPSSDATTIVGKELQSIATAAALVGDQLDTALDESFPDTANQILDRWEKVARVPSRPADALATRQARVLSVLRRTSGPRLAQLEQMLAGPMALATSDIVFIEQLRSFIEDALTQQDTTSHALTTSAVDFAYGAPWPGVVDDMGVSVYFGFAATTSFTATIRSPRGTLGAYNFGGWASPRWIYDRTTFLGEPAGGRWTLTIATTVGTATMNDFRLLVSNDIDSAQIYNFFALRDAALAGTGTPDITEAQRLFSRTALGNMEAHVIERSACIVDDSHSLCDREPVGD